MCLVSSCVEVLGMSEGAEGNGSRHPSLLRRWQINVEKPKSLKRRDHADVDMTGRDIHHSIIEITSAGPALWSLDGWGPSMVVPTLVLITGGGGLKGALLLLNASGQLPWRSHWSSEGNSLLCYEAVNQQDSGDPGMGRERQGTF
uniref:uncharacterized protein LOC131132505 isoform X2 n=1 Tax=Doryrhamphus excisus TaxID=161450 RepID=UPI0025AE22A4|nr:uncharacterized protein LOC131132505 isoform X2 [Doryrhamphus excisus]